MYTIRLAGDVKMNGPKTNAINGTRLPVHGTRARQIGIAKDTNSCKIVLLGCPGVGKTGMSRFIVINEIF